MQPRQPRARLRLEQKLADRFRELEPRAQIAAIVEWRRTVDAITHAMKKARRSRAERERSAANEGRTRRPEIPGVSGRIFDLFFDYVVEGANVGSEREMTTEDAPLLELVEVCKQLDAAARNVVRAAGGDRARARAGLSALRLHATALGYWHARGDFGYAIGTSIDLPEAVGKEKPAARVAALALAELDHSNAAIARALDLDDARIRAFKRSAGASYAAKS